MTKRGRVVAGKYPKAAYRLAAVRIFRDEGALDVDGEAKVTLSPEDSGASVQAWAWVYGERGAAGHRNAARRDFTDEGTVEIAEDAEVLLSDDGARVESWVWVNDDDVSEEESRAGAHRGRSAE